MVVLQLLEFGVAVVFSLGNADAGRANVGVSALVVLMCCLMLIEVEFGINCIGLCEHMIVVGVGCDVELTEA